MEGVRAYESFDIKIQPSLMSCSGIYRAIDCNTPPELCGILERNGLEIKTILTEYSPEGEIISSNIRVHGTPERLSKFKSLLDVWSIEKAPDEDNL